MNKDGYLTMVAPASDTWNQIFEELEAIYNFKELIPLDNNAILTV